MLLLAIPSGIWPYGYYQILRWVVTATAIYVAYNARRGGKPAWSWVMGMVAVLFNPLWPIYLSKGTWIWLDLIVAILFLVSIKKIK